MSLRVFVGTWNVGNAIPSSNLGDWIQKDYDLYWITTQECAFELAGVETSSSHFPHSTRADKPHPLSTYFEELFMATLNTPPNPDYYLVTSGSAGNIRFWLFGRAAYQFSERFSKLDVNTFFTGAGAVTGNKGAVGVSFMFDSTFFCFVGTHLAAHQGHTADRNSNFLDICKNLKLGWPKFDLTTQFDYLFWAGDLNYRIDLPRADVLTAIAAEDYLPGSLLQQKDQLLTEQAAFRVFQDFTEGPITFPPTYKFVPGVQPRAYDEGEKQRVPSWCDRILLKSMLSPGLLPSQYCKTDTIISSDHNPVWAEYVVPLRPNPSNWTTCQITLSSISAFNLAPCDVTGKSDPCVEFYPPFQDATHKPKWRTSVRSQTLEPDWGDEVVQIPNVSLPLDQLATTFVLTRVMDHDTGTRSDLMGHCWFPLAGATGPDGVCLTAPVVRGGERWGSLKLTVRISSTSS